MKKITEILARNLSDLRDKHNLTQAELGARAGISGESVESYERQIRWPKPPQISALAKALGVPEAALYDDNLETIIVRVEPPSIKELLGALSSLDDTQIAGYLDAIRKDTATFRAGLDPDSPAKPRKTPKKPKHLSRKGE